MTYRSMSDCLIYGLPGYDEWKTRSPDDDRYDDEPEPEDYDENGDWYLDTDSLDELFCFYDTHELDDYAQSRVEGRAVSA